MLVKCDAKGLEWRTKVWLAQDKVAMEELLDPTRDVHAENQEIFKLPKGDVGRTIAKNFLYRMIFADAFGDQGFRGPAYAFVNDPNFMGCSTSIKFWEGTIGRFFEKYSGIYNHSVEIIRQACSTGYVESPSGRIYRYHTYTGWNGDLEWPRTQILNHIVQGFSADLMVLVRRIIYRTWPDTPDALLINTVHDDVEADIKNDIELIYHCSCLMQESFEELPKEVKKWFGVDLNVPMEGETKFGYNLSEEGMIKFKKQTFIEDYKAYANSH